MSHDPTRPNPTQPSDRKARALLHSLGFEWWPRKGVWIAPRGRVVAPEGARPDAYDTTRWLVGPYEIRLYDSGDASAIRVR